MFLLENSRIKASAPHERVKSTKTLISEREAAALGKAHVARLVEERRAGNS
jgi:hypothetical protein